MAVAAADAIFLHPKFIKARTGRDKPPKRASVRNGEAPPACTGPGAGAEKFSVLGEIDGIGAGV